MNKYKAIVRNVIYVGIGSIGSRLIHLFLLPLYTRWLTTSEFGISDLITVYADIFIILLFLKIEDAIFVYPKTATDKVKAEYFSSGLFFGVLAAFVFALILGLIGYSHCEMIIHNSLYRYRWLIFWLLVTRHIQYYTQSFTRALDRMELYSFIGVLLVSLTGLLSFIMIPLYGLYGYLYAIIFANLITSIHSFVRARMWRYCDWHLVKVYRLKELFSYSIPLVPNSLMFWLTSGISRPLMEAYLGLSAIGIYAVANRLSSAVGTVSSIVALAWNNSVLDEYGHEGFDRFYNNYLRVISSIYFLCCALIILFSRLIIELFSSPEYYAASLYLPVLTINMTLFGLASSVGSIYAAVKKSKYFFYSSAVGAIISLISIYPLIKYGGLMGVCVSAALSSMGTMIFRWYYASKFVKLDSISFYSFGLLLLFVMAFINHSLPPIACYIIQLSIILFFLFYSKGLIKQVWNVICIKKRV